MIPELKKLFNKKSGWNLDEKNKIWYYTGEFFSYFLINLQNINFKRKDNIIIYIYDTKNKRNFK